MLEVSFSRGYTLSMTELLSILLVWSNLSKPPSHAEVNSHILGRTFQCVETWLAYM